MPNQTCPICNNSFLEIETIPYAALNQRLRHILQKRSPTISENDHICIPCFETVRTESFETQLKKNQKELSHLERVVLEKLDSRENISVNPSSIEKKLTFGQKISDKIASFGGSWAFILSFLGMLIIWIIFNSVMIATKRFDPYPFILLNLVLSCVAALQAPVIMMSQNRKEEKDRERAENDYMVNLKSELEIRTLHEKMDHLLRSQMHTLMEFQEAQLEILQRMSSPAKDQN
ncbi:MAG: DUF1003 domain-containing protein [Fimbriimonadaceae bacterium]